MKDDSMKYFHAALRNHFPAFASRTFKQVQPGTLYLPSWHIEAIAAKLSDVAQGKTRRLIINLPPRYMKSLLVSVAFPAWLLGHDATRNIIGVSYSQELATRHSSDCRAVMESEWYRNTFATRLSSKRNAVTDFETTQRGFRFATSTGGSLTGRGGDLLIIDDPLKPDEALSDTQRRRANDWYDHTLHSRQNNKNTAAIVVVMHRLHEDDLTGHLLSGPESWELLSIPAIAETQATFELETPLGRKPYTRGVGEVLHPALESREGLGITRATIGEYNFAGQYQQSPAPLGGGLVKQGWFLRYRSGELPVSFDQIICSWDTAISASELANYSVCTTWGVKDRRAYLLDVYRRKVEYPDLKRAVAAVAKHYGATIILIEDAASGKQIVQELKNEGVWGVKAVKPEGDKIMRFNAQTPQIENGMVYVPDSAPWLAEYLHELSTFPSAKNDDQVDSTAQALKFIAVGQTNTGLLEFYKKRYEDAVRAGGPELPGHPVLR